jgi:sec-independent protein translocase protein TatA
MNIFGIGLPEMAVIAAIGLLVFGPKRLPELGKTLGKTLKGFQSASSQFEQEFRKAVDTVSNDTVSATAVSTTAVSASAVSAPAVSAPADSATTVSAPAVSATAVSAPADSATTVSAPAVSATAVSAPADLATAVSPSPVSAAAESAEALAPGAGSVAVAPTETLAERQSAAAGPGVPELVTDQPPTPAA